VAAGGTVHDVLEVDRGAFACMLGGETGRTLFVVANRWEGVQGGASSGVVLSTEVTAARAGRP
jgi:sugar lactone lactonase YvrE